MEHDCVFCDRTKLEERIIAEDKEYYVVATLGQITDGGYVLVIPKEHIPCFGAFSLRAASKAYATLWVVSMAVACEYQQRRSQSAPMRITVFEHGIIRQTIKHAHFHILPAAIDLTPKIQSDFPNNTIEKLRYVGQLQEEYGRRNEPYILWHTRDGDPQMVCWNPPIPPAYLRLIAADLLGHPERGDWRKMDPELDKRLWQETVIRLKPYFS